MTHATSPASPQGGTVYHTEPNKNASVSDENAKAQLPPMRDVEKKVFKNEEDPNMEGTKTKDNPLEEKKTRRYSQGVKSSKIEAVASRKNLRKSVDPTTEKFQMVGPQMDEFTPMGRKLKVEKEEHKSTSTSIETKDDSMPIGGEKSSTSIGEKSTEVSGKSSSGSEVLGPEKPSSGSKVLAAEKPKIREEGIPHLHIKDEESRKQFMKSLKREIGEIARNNKDKIIDKNKAFFDEKGEIESDAFANLERSHEECIDGIKIACKQLHIKNKHKLADMEKACKEKIEKYEKKINKLEKKGTKKDKVLDEYKKIRDIYIFKREAANLLLSSIDSLSAVNGFLNKDYLTQSWHEDKEIKKVEHDLVLGLSDLKLGHELGKGVKENESRNLEELMQDPKICANLGSVKIDKYKQLRKEFADDLDAMREDKRFIGLEKEVQDTVNRISPNKYDIEACIADNKFIELISKEIEGIELRNTQLRKNTENHIQAKYQIFDAVFPSYFNKSHDVDDTVVEEYMNKIHATGKGTYIKPEDVKASAHEKLLRFLMDDEFPALQKLQK
jgi:hypothetical protein